MTKQVVEEPKAVLIVTALDVETRAILRKLPGDWRERVVSGTVFYVGKFEDWDVAVVEVGSGNVPAAAITERGIREFGAEVALFVGVAGGMKDVEIGDVVVASKVYGYEGGKDEQDKFRSRADLHHSAHAIEQRARAVMKRDLWHRRLDRKVISGTPKLLVGPIAAGEKIVASTRSTTAQFLIANYGDTLAVEMEGRGFLEAVHINQIVGGVVRGISDLLSEKSISDAAGWQSKAAEAAASVAFEILATLTPNSEGGSGVAPSRPDRPAGEVGPDGAKQANSGAAVATTPLIEIPRSLSDATFFKANETLARVGVPDVDEVLFSFQTLPDSYLRIIPRGARARPLPRSFLRDAAAAAPLLKLRQYGAFSYPNDYGAIAYDPGGPHRGGPAPLSWATQLFPNGELWLMSNTTIVRDRGPRPSWVPIPFIPAVSFEQIYFTKLRESVAFALDHLELAFPADIEMGIVDAQNVTLAIDQEDMRPIRTQNVVVRKTFSDAADETINGALLEFFNEVYDATGYARPETLFGFPPGPPRPP
jgi:nucleoside phosphorylase